MKKHDIGVIGLAVMGKNLALNMADHGFSVAAYNRSESKTRELIDEYSGDKIEGFFSIESFCASLASPRRVFLMVKAGQPVDGAIEQVLPFLEKGDIIIDGGNSYFMDTVRRSKELADKGFMFIGTGVSGGEEGARFGPAIIPGGEREAYDAVAPILTAISAHVDGDPCCTYIGKDGAGHYVKMVHNGIEYGDMQLICEAYSLLENVLGLSAAELHEVFSDWNSGELDSYLIEITRNILAQTDPETGRPMVDIILDTAGQKGTGKWTGKESLDLGVPAPTITEAVYARYISAMKDERVAAAAAFGDRPKKAFTGDKKAFIESVRRALYASKICSYAQGFALMDSAAKANGWTLDYGAIAMIFRGGCIIRARFLHKIKEAFDRKPDLKNLMLDSYFKDILLGYEADWRAVAAAAIEHGLPVPAFMSALSYFDSYRSARLPANLLQAQRDYFGAHTFERTDKPGIYHHQWI